MIEFALEYPELMVLDPDVAASTKTAAFGERFPGRFFETGIAEQNTIGIAAVSSGLRQGIWI